MGLNSPLDAEGNDYVLPEGSWRNMENDKKLDFSKSRLKGNR